jgi:hypothetical protein
MVILKVTKNPPPFLSIDVASRKQFYPACGNYTTKIPLRNAFPRLQDRGLCFAFTNSAFNRILDFSNGLDFYLGFFLSLPE